MNRRTFNASLVSLAFAGLSTQLMGCQSRSSLGAANIDIGYGNLVRDPDDILDLPEGFSYRIISQLAEPMDDGLSVPDRADGMGCFYLDPDRVTLVRNHELPEDQPSISGLSEASVAKAYDVDGRSRPLAGGTSSLVYNLKSGETERQFMSLLGTVRNCAGGVTPWQSWLTCEESVLPAGRDNQQAHGYVFEVPADATGLVDAQPLTAMGRFNHEAACVDPRSGIVYLTEDRDDSLFYRFIPDVPGRLHEGGKLQALMVDDQPRFDTRNWYDTQWQRGESLAVSWVDLTDVTSPDDSLRFQGLRKGAARFARGEGIHWAERSMYFCCTSGGARKLGQVMELIPADPSSADPAPDQLVLVIESEAKHALNFADNICVAPNGHMLVCEDQYSLVVRNHLKGVTPDGDLYDFARIRWQTEPAGVCFSPDGTTLFVNLYSPTTTLAITGPWKWLARVDEVNPA